MKNHLFTHLVIKTSIILAFLGGLQHTNIEAKGSLPDKWWEMSLAKPVYTSQEYFEKINGEYKNKFVFIDFYMEYCSWCYYIQPEFNELIQDMLEWYGEDKVVFLKVDGNQIKKLQELYKIQSYPSFIAVVPNTAGKTYSTFKYQPRNYETLKKWMLEILGTTPLIDEVQSTNVQVEEKGYSQVQAPATQAQLSQANIPPTIPKLGQQPNHSDEVQQLREQLNQILSENSDSNNIQNQKLAQAINNIGQQQQNSNEKMDVLIKLLQNALMDDNSTKTEVTQQEQTQTLQSTVQLSPATYILIGLVGGTLAAVTLIAYVGRQNMKVKKTKMRRGPSSGSPLTGSLDEEKSA